MSGSAGAADAREYAAVAAAKPATPDADELRAIETATQNAAQVAGELLYDGWRVRLSAGLARRARSVHPQAAGELPLDRKLAHVVGLYEARALTPLVRITPLAQPDGLDAALQARGCAVVEPSLSMTRALRPPEGAVDVGARSDPASLSIIAVDVPEFVRHAGAMRALAKRAIDAQIERMQASTLRASTVCMLAFEGAEPVAAGQVVCEQLWAGLYDIVVASAWRGRGLARWLVQALLDAAAREHGASHAYLQVAAANAPARRLYETMGFTARYAYWYRRPAHHSGT